MAGNKKGSKAAIAAATVAAQSAPVVNIENLKAIAGYGVEGVYTPEAVYSPLVAQGYVEINTALVNEAGEIVTRVTQAGSDLLAITESAQALTGVTGNVQVTDHTEGFETKVDGGTPSKPRVKITGDFSLDDSVPIPEGSARGRGNNGKYPFEVMQPGQSFFVANSEDVPDAAKSLASTVSSATARYVNEELDENGKKTYSRKFIVRAVEENGVSGARVWRQY